MQLLISSFCDSKSIEINHKMKILTVAFMLLYSVKHLSIQTEATPTCEHVMFTVIISQHSPRKAKDWKKI